MKLLKIFLILSLLTGCDIYRNFFQMESCEPYDSLAVYGANNIVKKYNCDPMEVHIDFLAASRRLPYCDSANEYAALTLKGVLGVVRCGAGPKIIRLMDRNANITWRCKIKANFDVMLKHAYNC